MNNILALFHWYFYIICSNTTFHWVHLKHFIPGLFKRKILSVTFSGHIMSLVVVYVLVFFIELNHKIIFVISFPLFYH